MNLRTLLLSGAVLFALTATFGFKSKTVNTGPVSIRPGTVCTNFPSGTNEPVCTPTGTGPQCTVTGARYLAYQFEATTTPTCSVPLRTPY